MIEATNDEIKFWYDHLLKNKKQKLKGEVYAHRNNLSPKALVNWKQRFNPWSGKFKLQKDRELELYDLYKATGSPRASFCAKHNLPMHRLTLVGTYLEYKKRLEQIYGENVPSLVPDKINIEIPQEEYMPEPEPITTFRAFTPIPTVCDAVPRPPFQPPQTQITQSHEVIEAKNDVELSLKKGVKVILSPEIDTSQIIKIIEFLKEL